MQITPNQPKVLIVDDEPMHNLILEPMLSGLGMRSAFTTTAAEFLVQMNIFCPDICLVDVHLRSAEEGFELIKVVRSQLESEVPIIIVSKLHDQPTILRGIDAGANDFLVKPVDQKLLAWKLRQFIKTKELGEYPPPFFPLPKDGVSASIALDAKIVEVNELGLKISSSHLPLKRSAVQLESPLICEITGKLGPQKFMVVSTANEDHAGNYSIFLEFATKDEQTMVSIKKWLLRNKDQE